ncbi:DUF6538 domain-containing protein [Cupriavidus basilensis]
MPRRCYTGTCENPSGNEHHIQLRGSVYYFRRKIPLDLIEQHSGKREIIRSLGTKNLAEAERAEIDAAAAATDVAILAAFRVKAAIACHMSSEASRPAAGGVPLASLPPMPRVSGLRTEMTYEDHLDSCRGRGDCRGACLAGRQRATGRGREDHRRRCPRR